MNSIERIKNIIATQIRTYRLSKGWTQERLAEEASLAPTFISRIESESRLLSLESLCQIGEALGLEVFELLISAETAKTSDYRKKQLIRIIKKSSPEQIDLYFDLVSALDKKNLKHK
ncbi:MAG: helix-turn-helix transcriptional regulator [Candidatus Omnitrophica bacterium]|nr:helix-turn-helix transcriptional regulator [Candidatus Omnitrophota bacterium]MBU4492277.1 helix-turn-helix transcriptional regulator [Euryarchaeota archaeon]